MHQQETQKVETKWETNKTNFERSWKGQPGKLDWLQKKYDDLY